MWKITPLKGRGKLLALKRHRNFIQWGLRYANDRFF